MPCLDKARWQLASPLLDQLLDADVAARAAHLGCIRRADEGLAAELEALLAQSTAANREAFLDRSLLHSEAGREGAVIGGYTLEALIGRGGMGSVWRARAACSGPRVAIKFLHLALLRHGGGTRFAREAEILSRLDHRAIARLLGSGVAPGGQPYLVLDLVDGLPIDEWCDARAASAAVRLQLFVDVLAAVSHAHARRVLHCDLKPSNILVSGGGRVMLLDFGVARLLDQRIEAAPAAALWSAFTPNFAAPEQIDGGELTEATDVHALGRLLQLLLPGRAGLAPVIAKALRPRPADRYATPAEMADALRPHLDR